jgi:hypothetical protein
MSVQSLVRPFTLLGQNVLDDVQRALAPVVAAWSADWGVAPALLAPRAERACDAPAPPGDVGPAWSYVHAQGRSAWLDLPSELAGDVQRALFAPEVGAAAAPGAAAHFSAATARGALDALTLALGRSAVGDGAAAAGHGEPDAAAWKRGAGSVLVFLGGGARPARLLLDGASVRALCAPAAAAVAALPPLAGVDLRAAVASQEVRLQLSIGGARVAVGSLLTLGVGDVIRLDSLADAPVTLSTSSGTPLLSAYLGRAGADVAVEIAGPY